MSVLEGAICAVDALEMLQQHHSSYVNQLAEAKNTVQQITGAVIAVANLIRKHEMEMENANKPKVPEPGDEVITPEPSEPTTTEEETHS